MDETSRTEDPEVMEAIASLSKHPGLKALVAEVIATRDRHFVNLARGLGSSSNPVDQREIDEKRGFWKGAIFALNTFPKQTSKDWDKFVEDALKEADEVA